LTTKLLSYKIPRMNEISFLLKVIKENLRYSHTDSPRSSERSEQTKNKVDAILANYMPEHPPSLAHGYSHFIKVTGYCCDLSQKTLVERPDLMYVVGLYHDVYRPAEGKDGKEDHESKGAEIIKNNLVLVLPPNDLETVASILIDHDKAIIAGMGTKEMKILSLADKVDMSAQRCIAYAWASNKNARLANDQKPYPNFKSILEFFRRYRTKADKVFERIGLEDPNPDIWVSKEWAKEQYDRTELELAILTRKENSGEIKFAEEFVRISLHEAMMYVEYLKRDGFSN
jgi:hypothetical protein